jgi:hypothetical protein
MISKKRNVPWPNSLSTKVRALPAGTNLALEGAIPLQTVVSLHLARRKSLQHAPAVSSPLARKSWILEEI